jgi:DNA-binding beta-propeller fold protein YncE
MRKIIAIIFAIIFMTIQQARATALPENLANYIKETFPKVDLRFDGVILLPDGTQYLPLLPSKVLEPEKIEIVQTYPENKTLSSKPNVVIFNNDYVLFKVLTDKTGNKTIYKIANPPEVIRTGLLPQDMLVPQGLVIPESMKGILGDLTIKTIEEGGIKVQMPKITVSPSNLQVLSDIPELRDKSFYIASGFSRNILVLNQDGKTPEYALEQKNVPISMAGYGGKFLLVTAWSKKSMDVISLTDNDIIKQIFFKSQPDEIVVDYKNNLAYISSSEDSSIYVVNLTTMTLTKQLKINGLCEKLTLSDDGTKLFYFDKNSRGIWAVELDNQYLLKDIGKFPNVSKIAYANGKIYIVSRTQSKLAIIDYATVGFLGETDICTKPVDMISFNDTIYILGAQDNVIQTIDTNTDILGEQIPLGTDGFSTKIYKLDDTGLAIITDTKSAIFSVFNLNTKKIIKTVSIDMPIKSIVVTDKVKSVNP